MVEMEHARRRLASRSAAGTLAGMPLKPTNVDEALTALKTVAERLRQAGDARAAFPDIYSIITRKVAEQVHRKDGIFKEPQWISRLAGRFCERYLETLRWSLEQRPQDCDAWSAAYACSAATRTIPVQHVLLGLSAHINFDLALGIYETILEVDHEVSPEMLARYKHDHDQVNALLLASIPEAFEHLSQRYGCVVSSLLYARAFKTSRWFTMQMLSHWRAQVWDNVLTLLAARSAAKQNALIVTMGRRSGFYGRLLKLPSDIARLSFPTQRSKPQTVAPVIPLNQPAKGEPHPGPSPLPLPPPRMCA
jgi:hypothetical protein